MQYLRYPNIPILRYKFKQKGKDLVLECKWENCIENFNMPIQLGKVDKYQKISPTTEWKSFTLKNLDKNEFEIPEHLFLIEAKKGW